MDALTIAASAAAALGIAVGNALASRRRRPVALPVAPSCEPVADLTAEVRDMRADHALLAARVAHLEARTPRT